MLITVSPSEDWLKEGAPYPVSRNQCLAWDNHSPKPSFGSGLLM